MQLEQRLKGPHQQRLAEVRRLTGAPRPPAVSMPFLEPEEAEERLRVAMVQRLPRAEASDDGCVRLLDGLTELWSWATTDVRALDAWHNAYEVAVERGLDPASAEFRAFLTHYAALLESWVARSA
jgi:hypothetical protein